MSAEILGARNKARTLTRKQARQLEDWVEQNADKLRSGSLEREVITALAVQSLGFSVGFSSICQAGEIVGVEIKSRRKTKSGGSPFAVRKPGGRSHMSPGWSAIVGLFDVLSKVADDLGVSVPTELRDTVEYLRANNRPKPRQAEEGQAPQRLFDR